MSCLNLKELQKQGYIGNPAQLVTLRRVTLGEGKAKGTEIIEVKTAGGLELDILPDRHWMPCLIQN